MQWLLWRNGHFGRAVILAWGEPGAESDANSAHGAMARWRGSRSIGFGRGDEHGCDPQQSCSEATATLFSVSVKVEITGHSFQRQGHRDILILSFLFSFLPFL